MSDHVGAKLIHDNLPGSASHLIADRGYDSDRFRAAFKPKGITPCIPPIKSRKRPLPYDKTLYKARHKIENMSARLKGRRRIATRHDGCAHPFFSAIRIAATVIFYLNQ